MIYLYLSLILYILLLAYIIITIHRVFEMYFTYLCATINTYIFFNIYIYKCIPLFKFKYVDKNMIFTFDIYRELYEITISRRNLYRI